MSILSSLKIDTSILEGDSFAKKQTFPSELYLTVIKSAYLEEAKSEALAVNITFDLLNGEEYKEKMYITSGAAKGKKNYYEKNGEKTYLPGFSKMNAICKLITGSDLSAQDVEDKLVKVYDFDLKKEILVKKPCITSLQEVSIVIGLLEKEEFKRIKDGNNYIESDEIVTVNEIDKIFNNESLSLVEVLAGKTEPEHSEKWRKDNAGIVRKVKKKATANTTTLKAAAKEYDI